MREIALDTETTGINPRDGHRIIEIGCLELLHHLPTGNKLHIYINPEREIDEGAVKVHGLTSAFLADKPLFADIVDEFLAFIGGDPMVIHNAPFDMGFLNAELARLNRPVLPMDRAVDTLMMARKKFPGAQANLDALCRRFEIDNGHRDLHGALIDADLLASVYIELLGGKQPGLGLDNGTRSGAGSRAEQAGIAGSADAANGTGHFAMSETVIRPIRAHAPSPEEQAAHDAFIDGIENPIWRQ
ncbi:DNA polymerase III subunit epsilon [Candidatus Puniceispirillum sp.]|uniref:DNA polymerase III subunit epsilon n=1 Tax=Candidatus Puniceispirillum sp. TaxID=2026719 RepID=UPI003F6A4636